MQLVMNWESGTEYLEINLDSLDEAEIAALTETREWWPDYGIFVYWNVTCQMAQMGDDEQLIVTYTQDEQEDENIVLRLQEDGYKPWCGQNSIFLEPDLRNDGGLCRKVPKRPHSGRRFGWGMGNIRKIWTRLMPSRKLFPGALCAMPVSS